ncbi:hypothetical protein ACJQWK_06078 [Exserohilum turcicum]|uniref:ABM domain-containing protein n=1 Tax=Exserohilum turcicum (strain 28A) TaxID=671987 RepID=R0K6V6_EXST2|nr:uncharacterized protein SETTUDRAFT_26777 [Exserohilum turcica Et28A]EOA88723.1 hypothetical protein SETTUDRAFT_26777 [Exserohilum turcica Et28A]
MAPIEIVAMAVAKPGKADRLQEVLEASAQWVRRTEPGALRYLIQRQVNAKDQPTFVVLETYEDQAALEFHAKSESVVETRRLLESEDLLSEPLKIMLTKDVGGYASKL